jgi:hypothetical protein
MKISFFGFLFLFRFSIQFPNITLIASTLCIEKKLSKEDSKFVDPILQGVKEALFFISNATILQSDWSTILKLFSTHYLVV